MARPRVFVSSTYYDLKHIRSSLENFIESLGFEAILSEKGDIAYTPDIPLDESCYREVENSDIFVIIIGGRYGSEKSGSKKKMQKQFFDRYESITKTEYFNAIKRDVPIYILVEKSVYAEFETFLKNKNNELINYAHVDSVNIFHFVEDILAQPKNNPVHQFERYNDIEVWLKEQWSGLFRELINQRSKHVQINSLSYQITKLEENNKTLKHYLEEIMLKMLPEISGELIAQESKRLEEAKQLSTLENTEMFEYLESMFLFSIFDYREAVIASKSSDEFLEKLSEYVKPDIMKLEIRNMGDVTNDLSQSKKILGLNPIE